jgi:hypothetical protein
MDQPSMPSKSGGFDMASMSLADKLLLGGAVLLVIDIFMPWQGVCANLGPIGGSFCVNAKATGGDAGFLGVLMLIGALGLIVWEIMGAMGQTKDMGGMSPSKIGGFLGLGVAILGLLKFLFSAFSYGRWGAWVGLVLILVIAYGAFLKLKESGAMPMSPPAPPTSGGDAPIA